VTVIQRLIITLTNVELQVRTVAANGSLQRQMTTQIYIAFFEKKFETS